MDQPPTAVSAATLVATTGRIIRLLHGLYTKVDPAPSLLASLTSECTVIGASLGMLRSLQYKRHDARSQTISEHEVDIFEIVSVGCALVLSVLEKDLQTCLAAQESQPDAHELNRFELLLSKGHLQQVLLQLQGQKHAIELLLTILRSQSTKEVDSNTNTDSDQIFSATRSVQKLYPNTSSLASQPVHDYESSVGLDSVVTNTQFEFDDEITASRAYQRVQLQLKNLKDQPSNLALEMKAHSIHSQACVTDANDTSKNAKLPSPAGKFRGFNSITKFTGLAVTREDISSLTDHGMQNFTGIVSDFSTLSKALSHETSSVRTDLETRTLRLPHGELVSDEVSHAIDNNLSSHNVVPVNEMPLNVPKFPSMGHISSKSMESASTPSVELPKYQEIASATCASPRTIFKPKTIASVESYQASVSTVRLCIDLADGTAAKDTATQLTYEAFNSRFRNIWMQDNVRACYDRKFYLPTVLFFGDVDAGLRYVIKTGTAMPYEPLDLFTGRTTSMTVELDAIVFQLYLFELYRREWSCSRLNIVFSEPQAVVVGFDIDSPETLSNVQRKWLPTIRPHYRGIPLVLVGCGLESRNDCKTIEKLERIKQRPISYDQGLAMAKIIGAVAYIECSIVTKQGITEVFETITKACIWGDAQRGIVERNHSLLDVKPRKSSSIGAEIGFKILTSGSSKI